MKAALVEAAAKARTLGPRLESWEAKQPDKMLLRCAGESVTYSDALRRTAEIAAGLQAMNVGKGDRVALISATRLEFALTLIALARMGAISVPLNVYLKGEFLRYQLADCQASVAIVDAEGFDSIASVSANLPELRAVLSFDPISGNNTLASAIDSGYFADRLGEAGAFAKPDLRASDPATILYTSGTTGMPKGCVCGQGYLMICCIQAIEYDWFNTDDILYSTFPLFHSAGFFHMVVGTIQTGASLVLEPAFSASAFSRRVAEEGATVAFGVGAVGMAVLAARESEYDRKTKLRLCCFPPMTPAGQEAFEKRFSCDLACGGYGQTELSPITQLSAAESKTARATLGRPVARVEVRLVDEDDQPVSPGEIGEIIVRPLEPDMMFQGYWNRPDATVAALRNLWLHTGDLAREDENGFFFFVDRKKDALRRRGENVSSIELERAILQHPKIAMVATHAVPSELGEDDIKACVVLAEDAELDPSDLFAFFRQNLPYYAIPRYVEFMPALPINALGRLMKVSLRERGVGNAIDFEALGLTIQRQDRRG